MKPDNQQALLMRPALATVLLGELVHVLETTVKIFSFDERKSNVPNYSVTKNPLSSVSKLKRQIVEHTAMLISIERRNVGHLFG